MTFSVICERRGVVPPCYPKRKATPVHLEENLVEIVCMSQSISSGEGSFNALISCSYQLCHETDMEADEDRISWLPDKNCMLGDCPGDY